MAQFNQNREESMHNNLPAYWLAPIAFRCGVAQAQTLATAFSGPQAAQASRPAYRSAFKGYQAFTDEKIVNWKEANDDAGPDWWLALVSQ